MGRESGFPDMRGEGILCRAYGVGDSFCQLAQPLRAGLNCVAPTALPIVASIFTQPLRAGPNVWHAYGVGDFFLLGFPALTGWANVCRAYGAFWRRKFESARASEAAWQTDFGLDKAVTVLVGFVL